MCKVTIIVLIGFLFLVLGCQQKEADKPSFDTFEISYTDGWITKYSFLMYSSKKYYCKTGNYYPQTGVLPDSIFQMADKLASEELLKNQKKDSIKANCYDCPILSIKINSKNKKVILYQKGSADNEFDNLIVSLSRFYEISKHKEIDSMVVFETENAIAPPFPPAVKSHVE